MLIQNNLTNTKIHFGEDCRYKIIDLVEVQKQKNVLLIASERSTKNEYIFDLIEKIQKISNLYIWTKVKSNPRTKDVEKCFTEFKSKKISHIVGIGGGSVMDLAKAVAIRLGESDSLDRKILEKRAIKKRVNKLILLPTTSGTGSELSYGSILTLDSTKEKIGLRGEEVAADFALVDPCLSYSMPLKISMISGFDALTHAIETWVSKAATNEIKNNSKRAIKNIFENLPKIFLNQSDFIAREKMCYSSMVMGLNLAISSTCLPHRLQYPIGASTDSAHGEGLAILYNSWMDHLLEVSPEKISECANWINSNIKKINKADFFVSAVKEFKENIGMNPTVNSLGIDLNVAKEFPSMVSGDLSLDPSFRNYKDVEKIYIESLGI